MPFKMRIYAIIGIILYASLFAVVSASLSAICDPNGHQAAVGNVNITGKLADYIHRPSEWKSRSLIAPFHRNAFLGSVRIHTDGYFGLDAHDGGCKCSDANNECCMPTVSSEAPFCKPSGSTCCTNTFCVESETCCGDGGCCHAGTSCYATPNGLGCCPHGDFCSAAGVCYDYTSMNCSGSTAPSPQCCPPDLPFCNFSEQTGSGCYATSATSTLSASPTKASSTKPKADVTPTSSTPASSSKTVTVTIMSNPSGGLSLAFPSSTPSSQTQENGEVTKYVLSNGAAVSLESNPDSQTSIASFVVTGSVSPISSRTTTSTAPNTSPTTVISASSPPVSTPPNSRATMGTAEFPLATTITTSNPAPILAPFRLVIDHPFVFLLLCLPWASFLVHEQFPGLLLEPGLLSLTLVWLIFTFVWTLANIMYHLSGIPSCLDSLRGLLVSALVTGGMGAEEGKKKQEKRKRKEEETKKEKNEEGRKEEKKEEARKNEGEQKKTQEANIEPTKELTVNYSELRVLMLRVGRDVESRERARLERSREIRQREVETREKQQEEKEEEEKERQEKEKKKKERQEKERQEKERQEKERQEKRKEDKKKRKEEEQQKKLRKITTHSPREPPVNFPKLKLSLLTQRLGTQQRELKRLEQSLEIRQREVEDRERAIHRQNRERLSIMPQQQHLQRPQETDPGLNRPELRYVPLLASSSSLSREEKARRREERVRRRHEEVRRRQERVMDQGGELRTAFFP